MARYKELGKVIETQVSSWFAANSIIIENPTNGIPKMTFNEVKITTANNVIISEELTTRKLTITLTNPPTRIPWVDQDYNQILDERGGFMWEYSSTDYEIAGLIASAYIYAAKEADKKLAFDNNLEIINGLPEIQTTPIVIPDPIPSPV